VHTILIGVALICLVGSVLCAVAGLYQRQELQFHINDRLPEGQKFDPLFWHYGSWRKFRKLVDQYAPDDPRRKRARQLAVAQVALFLTSAGILWTTFVGFSILFLVWLMGMTALMGWSLSRFF
jgi:hypothetical protein